MNDVITVIQQLGFPIAACVFMAYENHSMRKEFNEKLAILTQSHENETKLLTEALNNNTLAIQRLTDTFDRK